MRPMAATTGQANYEVVTNATGRVFRVGETPRDVLGHGRWVPIMAAWLAMCLAGLLEYTWGALNPSLSAVHHWGPAPVFWAFSFFVIFESFVQIFTGYLRNHGILSVRWATIAGGLICGVIGYGILAESTSIWVAYIGYAVLGGIGSGMVYSSCINIVAKWYPEKKGWRTGFVNGGWAYGAVPFILVIGGFSTGAGVPVMSAGSLKTYIWVQAIIMTVGIILAGFFLKDPPKNWWPKEIDPLNWHKNGTRDLRNNPPALRHYNGARCGAPRRPSGSASSTPSTSAAPCSGWPITTGSPWPWAWAQWQPRSASPGSLWRTVSFRPVYGYISEFIGRRRTMIYAYSGNVVFQLLALWAGEEHNTVLFVICAVISGGLSGANFPMTAAMVADYYGETNNAINYGSIYAFKALGGSFAGGIAALIMTGTLYGTATFHWERGFFFGAALGALAALTVAFFCKPPTQAQMERAVRVSVDEEAQKAKPAIA